MKRLITAAMTAVMLLTTSMAHAQKLEYDDLLQGERFIGTTYKNVFPRGNAQGWTSLSARVDNEGQTHYYVELMLQTENDPHSMDKGSSLVLKLRDGQTLLLQSGDEGQESHREHLVDVEDKTTWRPVVGLVYDPWRYRPFIGNYMPVPLDAVRTYYHHEVSVTDRVSAYYEVTAATLNQIINGKVMGMSIQTREGVVEKVITGNRLSKTVKKDYRIIQKRLAK